MMKELQAAPADLATVIYGVDVNIQRLVDFVKAVQEVVKMPEFAVVVKRPDLDDPVAVQAYLLACLKISRVVVAKTPNQIDDAIWEAAIQAVQSEAFPAIHKLVRGLIGGDNDGYNVMQSGFVSPNIILIVQLAVMVVKLLKEISNVVNKDMLPVMSKN